MFLCLFNRFVAKTRPTFPIIYFKHFMFDMLCCKKKFLSLIYSFDMNTLKYQIRRTFMLILNIKLIQYFLCTFKSIKTHFLCPHVSPVFLPIFYETTFFTLTKILLCCWSICRQSSFINHFFTLFEDKLGLKTFSLYI